MIPFVPLKSRLLAVLLSLAIFAPIAIDTPAEATQRGYRWLQQKVQKRKKAEALKRHRAEMFANRKKRLAASAARAAAAKARNAKRKPWTATAKMREIRGRMLKGRNVTVPELRLLADAGDSLAAYKVAKKLEDANDPKLLEQAVDYYARAASAGRVSALKPLSHILKSRGATLSRTRVRSAEKAMVLGARSGSAFAAETLADFYQSGEPFGKKPADAAAMLRRSIKSGNGQSAIDLALLLMSQGPLDTKTKTEVKAYLKVSRASDSPETRAMTQALIYRLDRPPQTSPELTQ